MDNSADSVIYIVFSSFVSFLQRHIKKITIVLVVLLLAGWISSMIYGMLKSAELSILVAPQNAIVKIKGKEYKNGLYKFFPESNVEMEISADGYMTETVTLDLNAKEMTHLRYALPDNDGIYNEYLSSSSEYASLKMMAGTMDKSDLNEFIEKTDKILAINDILPINVATKPFYKDAHGFIVPTESDATVIQINRSVEDCGAIPCLDVWDYNDNLDNVKRYMRDKGLNPDDYKISLKKNSLFTPPYEYWLDEENGGDDSNLELTFEEDRD